MSIPAYVKGFFDVDFHTENAGTAITEEIPGRDGARLALIGYEIVTGATAHTLNIMYPGLLAGCRNTVDGDAASGQKVIDVVTAPTDPAGNAVANNDIVAYETEDGSWEFNIVASLSTKAITHQNNLAKNVKDGARYFVFGVTADNAKKVISLAADTTNKNAGSIFAIAPFMGDPLYLYIANGTNASQIMYMLWAYINK